MSQRIFVFGSNLAGRHGKGSALEARLRHGAIYGQGVGRQGQSYAIPTKGNQPKGQLQVLPLAVIREHVAVFLEYARDHPELAFDVIPIGCGLAGYSPVQIAPMFARAPSNVFLPEAFRRVIEGGVAQR